LTEIHLSSLFLFTRHLVCPGGGSRRLHAAGRLGAVLGGHTHPLGELRQARRRALAQGLLCHGGGGGGGGGGGSSAATAASKRADRPPPIARPIVE
jgi:hypothetical protein